MMSSHKGSHTRLCIRVQPTQYITLQQGYRSSHKELDKHFYFSNMKTCV